MFLRKCLTVKTNYCRKLLLSDQTYCLQSRNLLNSTNNCCFYLQNGPLLQRNENKVTPQCITYSVLLHRKYYSKSITNDDPSETKYDKEIIKIKELYPQARVTLNELSNKMPEKVFDIHYKQIVTTPKGSKKKIVLNNDWSCTYSLLWPEKIKFESTAISKRQAAEKAATQALHWLYMNNRIDRQGNPVYQKNIVNGLRSTLSAPLCADISSDSIERIESIWNEYENGIKSIYEATFREGNKAALSTPPLLKKDSTIDEDDTDGLVILGDSEDTSDLKTQMHPVFGRIFKPPSMSTLARRERILKHKFQHYDESLTPLPIDNYA